MVTVSHGFHRLIIALIVVAFAGVALTVGWGLAGADSTGSDSAGPQSPAQPCVQGIWVYNPYVVNCNLQRHGTRVLGQAPDAGALIACKDNKQCLSLYINGGYGWYPGAILTPSYHP
ncbi:MAG: hypothetical protein ACOYEV_19300 [Candidatus Nanopelagicales bacterium]